MADDIVARRDHGGKLSPAQRDEVTRRYASGESARVLGAEFGVQPAAIRGNARRRGVEFPGRSSRRHSVNEEAFSTITPESAYWIGFLMADGNVSRNIVQLRLSAIDVGHIEKFRAFLGSSHPIIRQEPSIHTFGENPSFILSIHSKRMSEDLASFGVVPRKSLVSTCKRLEYDRDFWRGMVDGDGSVFFAKNGHRLIPILFLCGGIPLLSQFSLFVKSINPDVLAGVSPSNTIHQVRIAGRFAREVVRHLYDGAVVALERKMKTATQFYLTTY